MKTNKEKENLYKEEDVEDEEEELEDEEEEESEYEEEEEDEEDDENDPTESVINFDDITTTDYAQEINKKIDEQRIETEVEKEINDKLEILDLDLENIPKDELINMLLAPEDQKPLKKKKPLYTAKSKINQTSNTNIYLNTNYNKLNNKNNPESTQDFNTALTKVLSKMVNASDYPNQEIFDLLITDKERITEELKKVKYYLI
jgi:hypothetical protein